MPSRARRLYDLEIDEVSLVDRPANQHGMVAIAKRAEAPGMSLIDDEGYEVDPSEAEIGETLVDTDTGQRYQVVSPEDAVELGYEVDSNDEGEEGYEVEDAYDDEPQLVGKSRRLPAHGMVPHNVNPGAGVARTARFESGSGGTKVRGSMGPGRGTRARAGARNAAAGARNQARRAGANARGAASFANTRAGRGALYAGGGYAAGQYEGRKVNKSIGESVLEELSKALDDGDRDEVISKMGDMIETANNSAARAWRIAKSVQDQQEARDYAALAATYDLPVEDEYLGGILQRVSKTLDPQELAVLDRVLSASSVGFEELGYAGEQQGDVMGQIMAVASEAVAKSEDGLTDAQAVTALMEANPELYDEYCSEQSLY